MTLSCVLRGNIKLTKRVGMLLHEYYPGDVRVRRAAEALSEFGVEVHVVCTKYLENKNEKPAKKFEIIRGVHVHRLPLTKKRGSKFRYFFEFLAVTMLGMWRLTSLHMQNRFDAVHIHNMPDLLVFAGMFPKFTGAKLILDIHDPMSELLQTNYHIGENHLLMKIIKLQEKICYKLPDYLITVSYPMKENVVRKSKRSYDKVKIVHNFPDLSLFPICENNRRWPYNKDKFVLLYSGTVTEHYNLDTAVKAVGALTDRIRNIQLIILGEGNKLKQVLSLACELGISENIRHLEFVQQALVRKIIATADIGISTHQAGPFGDLYFSNKILEFMSQGLPLLCSRTKTIESYIPEDSIFYFEPGNVNDLVEKIIFSYNHPDFVMKKIKKAKKILKKYVWQKEKEKFVSFYRSLLN